MRNEILEYFRKANGNYVSGEQISRDLNVSRTAIWKHINILKSRGYIFESSTRKGYRLIYAPNLLTPLEIASVLHTETLGKKVVYFESTPSTNEEAKRLQGKARKRGRSSWQRNKRPAADALQGILFSFCERDLVFCHFPSHVFPDGGIKEHAPCSSRRLPRYPPSRTC